MGEEVVDLYGVLRMNTSGWTASIRAAGAEAETMAGRTKAGFAALQKAGFVVAAGLVAVGVASVKMASAFDARMELVHTQAGASQKEVDRLKQAVLDMAPAVGQGPQALADGLYHIESAGFRGAQALSMLNEAAKGASIGQADLEAVTQAMVGTMAVGFKDVHGAGDAMAYMNRIVGIGDMRMEKLAQSIATGVLPSFKSAGLGMKDYGAALATLTDNVTPADEAATRLRMTVSLMSAPSGPAVKALHSIGIGSTQLANDLRKPNGLLVAVMDLKTHLEKSGKTAAEQNQVIQKAFGGGRTSGAIMTLLEETDRLKSKYGELGTQASRSAQYQDAWAATQKQTAQQWKELTATVQKLGIELGNALIPKLELVASWLARHNEVVKVAAYVLGGLLVAALLAASVAVVQFTIAMAINPLTWIVLGVELLIAALYLLVTHWSTVWAFIKRIAGDVAHAVVQAWDRVKAKTSAAWGWVASKVSGAWQAVAAYLSSAWHTVADPVARAWHAVQATTTAAWGKIRGFFAKWWPLLLVIFLPPVALIIALWNHFHQAIWNTSTATWGRVRSFLTAQWNDIRAVASAVWAAIRVAIITPAIWVGHRLAQLWQAITAEASREWSRARAVAAAAWNALYAAVLGPVVRMAAAVGHWMARVGVSVGHGMQDAYNKAKGIAGKFLDVGKAIIEGIVHGVEHGVGALGHAVKAAAEGALKAAKSFLGIQSPSKRFRDEVGAMIPAGIEEGIIRNKGHLTSTIHQYLEGSVRSSADWLSARIYSISQQRDAVAARLKSANQKLVDVHKAYSDYVTGTKSKLLGQTDALQQTTAGGVVASLSDQLGKMRSFANAIATLRKRHLDKGLLQQLIDGGLDSVPTMMALAHASSSDWNKITQLQRGINQMAGSTSHVAADAMYGAGVSAAQGLVRGLQSQEAALKRQMDSYAKTLITSIKRALGIRSPSTVMADQVGRWIPAGIAAGVERHAHLAHEAVADLAAGLGAGGAAYAGGPGGQSMAAAAATAAGGGVVVNNYITVEGSVVAERDLLDLVRRGTQRYVRRNATTGLAAVGR